MTKQRTTLPVVIIILIAVILATLIFVMRGPKGGNIPQPSSTTNASSAPFPTPTTAATSSGVSE